MILHSFPDLAWLKERIAARFRDRRGINGQMLPQEGFPNVIIHAKAQGLWRPDLTGPISLFMNLQGQSRAGVDGRMQTVPQGWFFLSNRFQSYTLAVDEQQPAETFNIHIGEAFSEGVLSALLTPADTILANGLQQQAISLQFQNRLYRRDDTVELLVRRLRASESEEGFHQEAFEDAITQLLHYLLAQHREGLARLHRIPALKLSTRVELFRRLAPALDYLHTTLDADGDTLAQIACLSRFHFLRLFRQAYGCTPYQYGIGLRLDEAARLLRHSRLTVTDISGALHFENPQSFSRLFMQRKGCTPTQYRN